MNIRPILPTVEAPKVRAMLLEHWQETESHFEAEPEPNLAAYKACEDAGVVVAFGAFDDEDVLVGYAVAFVLPHMHHGFIYAQHDLLFLKKEYRSGRLGLNLMRRLEEASAAKGAKFILWHAKVGSDFAMLLDRMGYSKEEEVYRKDLSCHSQLQ